MFTTRIFASPVRSSIARHFSTTSSRAFIPVPYVTESIAGGWRTSDIFSKLLQERIICVNGEVNSQMSASITSQLIFLEHSSPTKPITMYINSPGGSVTAGLSIYDTMQYILPPISTVCLGQAASMGSLLLAGGAKGKRYSLKNSSIMVHQPSGGYSGQASDIAIQAKQILRVRETLEKIYQTHLTKRMELEEISKLMERDTYLTAEEALELGIIDEVLVRRERPGEEGGEKGTKDGSGEGEQK